jgi:AraC-like DNA-binding protein
MGEPFEFDYVTLTPEDPLASFVESLWYARGTVPYSREKIAPTGSTVGVFVLGDPILQTSDNGVGPTLRADRGFLIGPHDRPVINEPTGETYAVGIVTKPVGCEAVFGVGPSVVRGVVVDLETVWSGAASLRDDLLASASPNEMLSLVERHIVGSGLPGPRGFRRCEIAVGMLERDPTRAIADIASELGISHGYLDREFTRIVGLTPRSLARILRMRGLLETIDIRSPISWVDLAAEFGWFDQAHLIRDFKHHTGVTPTHYVDAQRATYVTSEAGDAAGFVPEI